MKKVLKIVLVVVFGAILLFSGLVARDLYIESKLNKIVTTLADDDTVDMDIKTSGDYAKVEQLIKKDYQEFYRLVDKILIEYENPIIESCLSADNYQKDGPLFVNTRLELTRLKEKREEIHNEMLEIVSLDNLYQKGTNYQLDDYYMDLYKKYASDLKVFIDEMIREDRKFDDSIDVVFEILDFLTENQEHWEINHSVIYFDDQSLIDQYNFLIDQICLDCEEDISDNLMSA